MGVQSGSKSKMKKAKFLTIAALILGIALVLDRIFVTPQLQRIIESENEYNKLLREKEEIEVLLRAEKTIKQAYEKTINLLKKKPYDTLSEVMSKHEIKHISLVPNMERKKVADKIWETTYLATFKGNISDLAKTLAAFNSHSCELLKKEVLADDADIKELLKLISKDLDSTSNHKIRSISITPNPIKDELTFTIYITVLFS